MPLVQETPSTPRTLDGDAPRIATTLSYPRRPQWASRVQVVDTSSMSRAAAVRAIVSMSADCDVLVLDGSIGIRALNPDLAAAAIVARRRRPPAIVIAECNWKGGSGYLDRVLRSAGIRAIDGAVAVYCVVSSAEIESFPVTWGIDADRVAFTPFYYTLSEDELCQEVTDDGGVFAGGNPMRDYGTLVEAARHLPVPVTIATSRKEVTGRADLPPNVSAGPIPHDDYVRRLRSAAVVAIPLRGETERSGGEQTYLNAMALGKLVVVSDGPGARDYIEDGVTGILVPPHDPAAMRDAIGWALAEANRDEVRRIGDAAREHVLAGFGPDRWVERLLDIAERAAR